MEHDQTALAATADRAADHGDHHDQDSDVVEVVEELLIEEISIDGMCGVY